ncbi:MAG: MIP/aquaporin family protein [Flavobacteriales bacterium]
MKQKLLAEFLGTFGLVLIGTGAIALHEEYDFVSHLGICLSFQLGVTAMILLFAKVSGAHINPAVTIAFAAAKLFSWREVLPYIIAQTLGAITASFLLKFIFPMNEMLGATQPSISVSSCFWLEAALTFILMLVVLIISQNKKFLIRDVALAAGLVVLLEAYFAGPLTGASMNPARSIGPAIVSGHLEALWIYIAAPIAGALSAVAVWKLMK